MLYAIVAVAALILDQAVKYWTSANIVLNTGVRELIPGFIHLANVHNTGAAFSFLEGARWFFVVLCVVFTAAVIVLLAKRIIKSEFERWTAVLVLAGAIGNCIDRVVCGYVVDMFEFEFKIFGMSFPVFNVADILITVGGILFCIAVILSPSDGNRREKPAAPVPEPREAALREAPQREVPQRTAAPRRASVKKPVRMPEPEPDPDDPFAEWEKARLAAGEKPAASERPAPKAQPAQAPVPPAAPSRPERPAQPAKPEVPSAPKAEPAPASDEYDLDSILNEFKDL